MPMLALNTVISASLRARYQCALGALPIGLMLLSPCGLWLASTRLRADAVLTLPPPSAVAALLLLLATLALMVAGYALGWWLNAQISRHLLGWPAEQVRAVYRHSEVPAHWLKEGRGSRRDAGAESIATWAAERAQGPVRFVLLRGALAWGGPMFVAMHVVPSALKPEPVSMSATLLALAIWAVGGCLFGCVMWWISEANYRKLIRRAAATAPHDAAGGRR